MRVDFRGWTADVDVEATRSSYATAGLGAAQACDCAECRNFVVARDAGLVYPSDVVDLLVSMGVDLTRESEVYLEGPIDDGRLWYGGWFNVVGRLVDDSGESTEVAPGFYLYPLAQGALVTDAFGDASVFRVEFKAAVPSAVV
jgi:hypothetical protein